MLTRSKVKKTSKVKKRKRDEFEEDFDFILKCNHLNRIEISRVKKVLSSPHEWNCSVCKTSASLWTCLTCSTINCGRYHEGHAKDHYCKTGHPLVIEINSRLCHCYECDVYVSNDTRWNHLNKIRELIDFSKAKFNDHDFGRRDFLETVLRRWRLFTLAKAFSKWKEVVRQSKSDKSHLDSSPLSSGSTKNRRKPGMIIPGRTGLRNLGNTCFMNSVLQSLAHIPIFRQYFLSVLLPPSQTELTIGSRTFTRQATVECLESIKKRTIPREEVSVSIQIHVSSSSLSSHPLILQELMRVLWSGKWSVVSPNSLLRSLWKYMPRFRGYFQQDAQEFLCYLVDRLHLELTKIREHQRMLITDIFKGELESTVVCKKCGFASKRLEEIMDLHLTLPVVSLAKGRSKERKSCHLIDCFRVFTATEDLETSRHCDGCNSNQEATRRYSISRLPDVLCIVLKRFFFSTRSSAKINTFVEFPLRGLDLAPFVSQKISAFYDLRSIVVHHGSGLQNGHYSAFVNNSECDTWLHANDSDIRIITPEEVGQLEAYLLFFERRIDMSLVKG